MKKNFRRTCYFSTLLVFLLFCLSACSSMQKEAAKSDEQAAEAEPDISHFLVAVEEAPDTVDFQCTSIHYTVAQNVFNRLVEMENNTHGSATVFPSLAQSWEVSEDGLSYTFHLREGVTFSNGSPLTSSDVLYTLTRLLTHPDSCNSDIAHEILGADKLEKGEADKLEGFEIIDDLNFVITLRQPFSAFLACLSMPGASILDEETTTEAGDRFGTDPEWTIGTGSFILWKWDPKSGMLLKANPNCWLGAPRCEGLDLRFLTDVEVEREMFENGELDILDLDELGDAAEYYMNGNAYQDQLCRVRPIGITYIALNESIKPLDNQLVRKALQLALNREMLLEAVQSGRGTVENGIFPHGLYGFNENLPEIPFDLDQAKELLSQAGYADGFDLEVSVKSSSNKWEMNLINTSAAMWEKAGIRVSIKRLEESEFMSLRKSGKLACYFATWTADFNDPDNFIYTFFGNRDNTTFRSLCYPKEDIMERVRTARTIIDKNQRLQEYRKLEEIIVQEDAAWIPLFSKLRYYVRGKQLDGFQSSWNGSVKNNYRYMSIER